MNIFLCEHHISSLMKGSGNKGFDEVVIEDDRDVLIGCIKTSRVLAELNAIMKSRSVPPVLTTYADMKAVRSVSRSGRAPPDLETMFLAGVAKEKDFGTDIRSALFNVDILRTGSTLEPTLKNICAVHSQLLRGEAERPKKLGPVPISLPENTMKCLAHLLEDEETDGLLISLGAYLLFERNRPFGDNGLISLVVFHMFLHKFGLLEGCSLCLFQDETGIEMNRKMISDIKNGAGTKEWLLFMLAHMYDAALDLICKEFSIEASVENMREIYQDMPFYSNQLMEILFSDLFVKGTDLISAGIAERVTAMKYLTVMEDMGILESTKIGRERIFKNKELSKAILGEERPR